MSVHRAPSRIVILDPRMTDVPQELLGTADVVVAAFWSSARSGVSIEAEPRVWPFTDLLQDSYSELVERTYRKACELEEQLPSYRGVRPLLGWEGAIADLLTVPEVGTWLFQTLAQQFDEGTEVIFSTRGSLSEAFSLVNDGYFRERVASEPPRSTRHGGRYLAGALRLAREVRRDRDYARLWSGPIEVLDSRYLLRQRLVRGPKPTEGGVWSFSSYANYTRALARHADQLQTGTRWLVNGRSPRKGLPPGVESTSLWSFGSVRTREHAAIIRDALASAAGTALADLVRSHLPGVLAEIDLLEMFVVQTRPSELWVANQWGSESAALQLATREGIPTIQVQHGILEQYYAFAPIRSNRFLVWGEFWKECLPAEERGKVEVSDPGGWTGSPGIPGGHVTFFSQPLGNYPLVDRDTYFREVVQLLSAIRNQGSDVVLRVHPQERIDDWVQDWSRWGDGRGLRIDKDSPLDEILRNTSVAITPLSTVLLSCVARGVPVVTLGWYGSLWTDGFRRTGAISAARSVEDAASLVERLKKAYPAPGVASQLLASVGRGTSP